MAYTKIHNITKTLNKAISYIKNPNKTDGELLLSGYNCNPDTAVLEFKMTSIIAKNLKGDYKNCGGNENIAHHMIQSFAPWDKVTPEEAHIIGKQWADEFLQGKYEYVIATHIDKGQIHNHIIFNSTSFYDFKKFNNYKVAEKMREISDQLCAENNLYIIPKSKYTGKSWYENYIYEKGLSWKQQIKEVLFESLKKALTYDQFCELTEKAGVNIKNAYDNEGKHIVFSLSKSKEKQTIRGNKIILGNQNLTRDNIKLIIESKIYLDVSKENENFFVHEIEYKSRDKKIAETKELANALILIRKNKITCIDDFDVRIKDAQIKINDIRASMRKIDEKNIEYMSVVKYLKVCEQYQPIIDEVRRKSLLTSTKYVHSNQNEINAYDNALKQIRKRGLDLTIDTDKVIEMVQNQKKHGETLLKEVENIENYVNDISKAKNIITRIVEQKMEINTNNNIEKNL